MEQQKQKCAATSVGSKSTGKRKVIVGSVWGSKSHGEFKVVGFNGCNDVSVVFNKTGYKTKTTSKNIRNGLVKDRMSPTVYGVGFIGSGCYHGKINGVESKEYKTWRNMMERCYSDVYQKKNTTYIGCTVCDEWHNFQNFAKWFEENYPKDGKVYHLDKDIFTHGNKIYGPNTCLFVSAEVNNFVLCRDSKRGMFIIGVSLIKGSGKFMSNCRNPFSKKGEYLGCFNSEVDAHLAWRKRKSELAYELAMAQDREEVKLALLNWKAALDNFEIHKVDITHGNQ